jgi:hypothetical protein
MQSTFWGTTFWTPAHMMSGDGWVCGLCIKELIAVNKEEKDESDIEEGIVADEIIGLHNISFYGGPNVLCSGG